MISEELQHMAEAAPVERAPLALVSAVIPAYNEAATVGAVVALVRAHPAVREVIVVDDGSRDGTAAAAEEAGADVIRLPRNCGKAAAMERGVAKAKCGLIFFIDGDMIGLDHGIMTELIEAVASGTHGMYAAVVGRKRMAGWLVGILPLLSGIRVLPRELFERVPARQLKGFRIELALNYFASRSGIRTGFAVFPGLKHVIKERKRGFSRGLLERSGMILDISLALISLYAGESLRISFARIAAAFSRESAGETR